MKKREKFLPVDLGHLEDKAQSIVTYFNGYHNPDRSDEYHAVMLKNAEDVARTLVRDFAYYFDNYEIGGLIPYGMDEPKTED